MLLVNGLAIRSRHRSQVLIVLVTPAQMQRATTEKQAVLCRLMGAVATHAIRCRVGGIEKYHGEVLDEGSAPSF